MKNVCILFIACITLGLIAQTEVPIKLTATIPPTVSIVMTNNIIAPVTQHTKLIAGLNGPVQFQLGAFPSDSDVVLHIINPTRARMVWPPNIVVMGAPMPTNEAIAGVIFEEVMGSIWAWPGVQYLPTTGGFARGVQP